MHAKPSRERIVFETRPHLGVQTLIVDDCQPRAWKAYHETYTTCVALRSAMPAAEWVYRGKSYLARAGGVQLMEPGETHANKQDVYATTFRVLMVPPPLMQQAMAELGVRSPRVHFKIAQTFDGDLFAAFRDFHASMETGALPLEVESRFSECLRLLAQRCLESPAKNHGPQVHSEGVRRAKDCLRESFRRNVGLDELARVGGVSKFHLARLFKREVGLAPHDYQIQLRLGAARDLLRKGHSIAGAAAETGFSDQSHFTRHFRQSWGITPKSYAESVRPIRVRWLSSGAAAGWAGAPEKEQ